jgi:DNA modification methylase
MEVKIERFLGTEQSHAILKPVQVPAQNRFPERYKIHQYWSRKPWYVVRKYIESFTGPGDVVLDPFIGSGVSACEALALRRRIVGCDINPIAVMITRLTCISPVDLAKLSEVFNELCRRISNDLSKLYETRCRRCNKMVSVTTTIWEGDRPTQVFYVCQSCGKRELTDCTPWDIERMEAIEKGAVPYWYPKDIPLPETSDARYLDQLFTKRNLLALSCLFNEIQRLDPSVYKDLLLLMFSATTVRCSRLIFVNKHRLSRKMSPSGVWGEKRFWLPRQFAENNVYYYFVQRFSKIIKAKRETNSLIGSHFEGKRTYDVRCADATNLSFIPDESIDYCFTDPPYGGSVQYTGLSTIWNGWLGLCRPTGGHEITINGKISIDEYENRLSKALSEIFRVLKPGRFMSVTFHNSDMEVWNSLTVACRSAGFELQRIVPQSPIKASHNQIDQIGTVKTDMVITFRKPHERTRQAVVSGDKCVDFDQMLTDVLANLAEEKSEVTSSEIYDSLLLEWLNQVFASRVSPHTMRFLSLRDIIRLLEERGLTKTYETVHDYKGKARQVWKWVLRTG